LPDISELNGNAIDSVAEFDGLAKASILDIDGVAVPPAVGAPAAAYSVRLLGSAVGVSSYTGACMRVRRASDNVEADVGFDAGELKLTSPISNTSDAQSYTDFADFVDHTGTPTDAFCRYWYDQSGNANDAGQSTAGSQPKIYDATTGINENGSTGNEKPALNCDGQRGMTTTVSMFSSANYNTHSIVCGSIGGGNFGYGASTINTTYFGAGTSGSSASPDNSFTEVNYYINGSSLTTPTRDDIYTDIGSQGIAFTTFRLGSGPSLAVNYYHDATFDNLNIHELIFWQSVNQESEGNRSGIESNQNGYYNTY